jgi:hypothetical protein
MAFCRNAASASEPEQSPSRGVEHALGAVQESSLSVAISSDGDFAITSPGISGTVIRGDMEAQVDSRVLRSSAYPKHSIAQSEFQNEFGAGSVLKVTHSGLAGTPDLEWTVRVYRDQSWGEI